MPSPRSFGRLGVLGGVLVALSACPPKTTTTDTPTETPTEPAYQPLDIPHSKYELDNGLDVILAPDRSTPIVYVSIWVHVGARDEEPGRTGFAHLFEHLMFQGSPSIEGEYFQPLQEVGANINGSTNQDRTNYHEELPARYLPMALWLESDRFAGLTHTTNQDLLDEQRGVVRNERRQRVENTPYGERYRYMAEGVFPEGHPYHHVTIGSHEDLEAATLDDVLGFFRTWYVPNNASLVIAGDFDEGKAKELVDHYFAGIPRGEEVTRRPHEVAVIAENTEARYYEAVPEHRVWMVWKSPSFYAPGDAELDLFASVVGDGEDSRLHKRLVKEKGLATKVSASQMSRLLESIWVIEATAAEGHTTDELVAEIDAVLAEILNDKPPTADEIDAATANFEAMFYGSIQGIEGKGELLQRYNMYLGDPAKIEWDRRRYLDTTPEEVLATATDTVSKPRFTLHILPEDAKPAEEAP